MGIDVDKSYKVLSPLIADKWDNWKCIDRMKEQNMTHIPFLFISAVNDTILDSVMMKDLKDYCENDAKFETVIMEEFEDCDHNDTYLCDGYTEKIKDFFELVASKK